MTVSRAYLKQVRAEQEYRQHKAALEQLGRPDLVRFLEIKRHCSDPDDPGRLLAAQTKEAFRQYVMALGLCEDCIAKLPDPLAESVTVTRNPAQAAP